MFPLAAHMGIQALGTLLWIYFALLVWLIYLIVMFIIVHIKKDTSLGNFTWGPAVLLLTLFTFPFGQEYVRTYVITFLIFLWCLRLTIYFFVRYKKGADPRYVAWLSQWKHPLIALLSSFAWVVILNGGFSLIMALPAIFVNTTVQSPINWLDILGIIIWIVGFYFETISDYQLYKFTHDSNNKGKVCTVGLWKYSRHPNYFGEILMWWGIYTIALSVPYAWMTIICPLAITTTLVFFTGIPWNEKAMENNAEYQEYKKHTSMLFPWFAKK